MLISIINRSASLPDIELQTAIRAINRQIREDFQPYWSFGATLRLEGAIGSTADTVNLPDMRGDAVLYIVDAADTSEAYGWHFRNNSGIPYGFVFLDLCKKLGENWTVTLSHEALELIGDAQVNMLVSGPHPANPDHQVFHAFEMCDAVQAETYLIDGVEVSNFVLPLYFTSGNETGGRNDFLGNTHNGSSLSSFGISPGGYVNFFDPATGKYDSYFAKSDKKAEKRLKAKAKYEAGRGQMRSKSLLRGNG
ncbi:MAG: hypothetical protein RIR00_54 [Pseudomonadota bacterium]